MSTLRLFALVAILAWPSSQSFAEEGLVFPTSSEVAFTWTVSENAVTLSIVNHAQQKVNDFYVSDFGTPAPELISCTVDGLSVSPVIETQGSSVYPDLYTTRWIIGEFADEVVIRIPTISGKLSFSGENATPFFGIMPAIAAPGQPIWKP